MGRAMDTATNNTSNTGTNPDNTVSPDNPGNSGSFLGNLYDKASDAAKFASDTIYAHTPQIVKDGLVDAYSAVLGDGSEPPSPPPDSQPAPPASPAQPPLSGNEIAHAALICGYTAQDAPRQMTDEQLAQYFGVSTRVIGASPEAFYRRWVIATSRNALTDAPVLCRALRSNPPIGAQVGPDVQPLAKMENRLYFTPYMPRKPALPEWMRNSNGLSEEEIHGIQTQLGIPIDDHPIAGTLETLLSEGTRLLSSPLAISAGGLGVLAKYFSSYPEGSEEAANAGIDPEKMMDDVQGFFTYQPRTLSGQSRVEKLNHILGYVPDAAGHGVADATTRRGWTTENSARTAAFTESILSVVPWLLGARLIRGKPDQAITHDDVKNTSKTNVNQPPGAQQGEPASAQPAETTNGTQNTALKQQVRNAEKGYSAVQHYQNLVGFSKEALQTSLSKNNPDLLAQLVQGMAQQHPLKGFEVDARPLRQALADSGMSPAEIQSNMPEVFEQLQNPPTGGNISIPIETLARHPEVLQPVLPFARITPEAMNYAEAQAMAREHFEDIARKIIGAEEKDDVNKTKPEAMSLDDLVNGPSQKVNAATGEVSEPKIEEPDTQVNASAKAESSQPPADKAPPSERGDSQTKHELILAPGGGLDAHEAKNGKDGGHTLREHVGKTEKELVERYAKQPGIKGSSSFYDKAIAEEAVAATIKANQAAIDTWLAMKANKSPPYFHTMPVPVGITVPIGSMVSKPAYVVKLLLKRDPARPLGYYILTGFPQ